MQDTRESVYKFRYLTETDYIDLDTLLDSQQSIKTSLQIIQKELYPESRLQFRVVAVRRGSFELGLIVDLLEQVLPLAPIILSIDSVEAISNVFDFLKSYIDLRQFLKGKKPSTVVRKQNNIAVGTNDGSLIVAENVWLNYEGNPEIDKAVRQSFRSLSEDASVSAIEVSKGNKKILRVKKGNFEDVAEVNESLATKELEEIKDTTLVITKAILIPGQKWKWGFIYQGRKINASISDMDFNKQVESGKLRFGHGDALQVKLKIVKEFDDRLGTYVEVEKRTEIIEVLKIVRRGKQLDLLN